MIFDSEKLISSFSLDKTQQQFMSEAIRRILNAIEAAEDQDIPHDNKAQPNTTTAQLAFTTDNQMD